MSSVWSAPPAPLDLRRRAWVLAVAEPDRVVSAEVRLHMRTIERVVDVGCGAGQELLPFLDDADCVGVDPAPQTIELARELLRGHKPQARVQLTCGRSEALPLRSQSFDLAICRLVLSYTDNRRTLREIARILRPGGGLVILFHTHRYYLRKLVTGLRGGDLRPAVYASRVLLNGLGFHLTGRQWPIAPGRETYITVGRIRRLAAAVGLDLETELTGSSPVVPILLFRRRA